MLLEQILYALAWLLETEQLSFYLNTKENQDQANEIS